MGGINQMLFAEEFLQGFHKRILEVGSKNHGRTIPFRKKLAHDEYIGLDPAEGSGVDVVGNLEDGLYGLESRSCDLIICCSVLEHTKKPWVVAENITKLLAPGGKVYITSPWVWRYHAYPDDYWRISFSGIKLIFPDLEFGDMYYSTYRDGEFFKCEPEAENSRSRVVTDEGVVVEKYLPYCEIHALGVKTCPLLI